ncbi:hypothetical protein K470DRAFT_297176 [Piedraia hortae CBS 480.64]|uniref:Mediator of RNA polymerase II transcription subunit 1 n=1 Tax=Piedraia hortae CBS 480.64 TaxID=1314780 RepID=A0A6A7BPR2_9PEZI|nr:hypothetical protein K470DRAFT_297176 [Piedraia hortae CBS 480.64]
MANPYAKKNVQANVNVASSAPRSVPSPAAVAGKTPVTTSSHGPKTIGGTPMAASLSQPGIAASPSPGGHAPTPALDGITPGLLTPGLGGIPMNITMSELGMSANSVSLKRDEDQERRNKINKMLEMVGKRTGKITAEGIGRVSRRVGFTFENVGTPTPTSASFTIGGPSRIVIDIEQKDDRFVKAQVVIDSSSPNIEAETIPMGAVLLENLQTDCPLTSNLDAFARNLKRLAHLDRLSINGINCFEAVNGIYTSLQRLYQSEVKQFGPEETLQRRGGRPAVHERGRIGLAIEYWQDYDCDMHRIHINVERSQANMYPPARVSDLWLPEDIVDFTVLPWQEPLPTFTAMDGMDLEEHNMQHVRFVMCLDPPLIVPYTVGAFVYASLGLPPPQFTSMPPAWHSAVIDETSTVPFSIAEGASSSRYVMNPDGKSSVIRDYKLTLEQQADAALKLEVLPFSHPKQIVELLPTFRQWARFGYIVKDIFGKADDAPEADNEEFFFSELLKPPSSFVDRMTINMALSTSPPQLLISLPCGVRTLHVLPNAELAVRWEATAQEQYMVTDALQRCGDFNVWLEWIQRNMKRRHSELTSAPVQP